MQGRYNAEMTRLEIILLTLLTGAACGPVGPERAAETTEINVAAAANLSKAFPAIAQAFEHDHGIRVTCTYGSTAYLAHQIENGAPFDVFAAADVEHVERLVERGFVLKQSQAVYARGRLVLWWPNRMPAAARLEDLLSDEVQFIALAKPEIAPYGRAAREAIEALGMWTRLQPKIVYAQNVVIAKQMADSGNADAAWVAASLLTGNEGRGMDVDPRLYSPVRQALGVVAASKRRLPATRFAQFVLGDQGQRLLAEYGYSPPQAR